MLTPKIRKTNLVKDNTGFKVGGFARTRAFGTRVYKVLECKPEWVDSKQMIWDDAGQTYMIRYSGRWVNRLRLMKIGETNKGRFKFTNSKPFDVSPGAEHWYYPAKGI